MKWKKLLLADDIELLVELEKSFLQREPFELLVARNGREAYMMASLEQPDLVVLNLDLAEINGDDCCRRIKLNDELQSMPVILVVPYGDDAALHRCYEACSDDYLYRPADHQQVVQKVARFLNVPLRAEPRVQTRLSIRYGVDNQQQLTDFSVNLSSGGVFIETLDPLPIATILRMEFILPDSGRIVHCQGKVAWINPVDKLVTSRLPPGMGIQFHGMGLDEVHAIMVYIKQVTLQPTW